ncbi:MAG: cyclic nucleotide-binding domain-containing protein [Pseudomonadota bacterium]
MPGHLVDFDILERGGFPLVEFAPDEKVFSSGESGACLYLVKSGKVQIVSFGTVLEVINTHGVFGEMALIDGEPRSATAIAVEPSVLAEINRDAFRHLVQQNPDFALAVMGLMAQRLRQMNESA